MFPFLFILVCKNRRRPWIIRRKSSLSILVRYRCCDYGRSFGARAIYRLSLELGGALATAEGKRLPAGRFEVQELVNIPSAVWQDETKLSFFGDPYDADMDKLIATGHVQEKPGWQTDAWNFGWLSDLLWKPWERSGRPPIRVTDVLFRREKDGTLFL